MPLSIGIGIGPAFGGSGVATPKAVFGSNLRAWWPATDRSALWQDTSATVAAVVGQPVLRVDDRSGNGLNLVQATSGSAPILRQRTDGVYYLDFTSGKSMSVPSSQALFKYLHDGTGGTFYSTVEWPQAAVSSDFIRTGSGTAAVGIILNKAAATESASYTVARGVSGQATGVANINYAFASSALRMLRFSYKNDGGASDFVGAMDSCRDRLLSATVNAPSAASSGASLAIQTTFNGFVYDIALLDRLPTQAEDAAMWAYNRASNYPVSSVDLTLIMGGQSNMSGRASMSSQEAEEKLIGVYCYTKAEEFRIATEPVHSIVNRPVATAPDEVGVPLHGHSLRAGKKLKTDSSKNVLLVPCAIGSTSIADWDTPATKADRSTLFGAMAYRYAQAASKGGTPVILWHGHEGSIGLPVPDYTNGGVGSAYQTAWTQLIADIRAEIVNAPLIFVQLASDDDLSTAVQLASAGEAQRQTELTIANAHMVVAHDLARNASTDDIHLARASMDTLGDRVALAIRQHVLGEVVNGTGPRIDPTAPATYSGSTITLHCNKALNTTAGNYGSLFRVYANGVEQTVSSANRGSNTSTVEIVCSAPLSGSITLTYGYRAGPASAARTDFVADADGLPLPLFGPIVVTL